MEGFVLRATGPEQVPERPQPEVQIADLERCEVSVPRSFLRVESRRDSVGAWRDMEAGEAP